MGDHKVSFNKDGLLPKGDLHTPLKNFVIQYLYKDRKNRLFQTGIPDGEPIW